MTSLADTLWQEFAIESEEHLQAVEPLLARGDPERTSASDIAQLFRSFHSLKGLARAMDVLGMEAVAHHAENLLGLIREGRATLNLELADLLLLAVDALKQMRGRIVAERADTQPDPALLARLAAAFAELGGADKPASEPQDQAQNQAPAETGGLPLHEDPDMLEIFVEMIRMRGPDLCGALSSAGNDRETAVDAAETLAHAAEIMGFDALAESFSGVLDSLRVAAGGELDPTTRQDLVSRFGDIRLQIELFGEITGQDAGATEFAAALAARVSQDHADLIEEFGSALENLRVALDSEDWAAAEADAAPVARLARTLQAALSAQSLTRLPQLFLLIEDLYSRAEAGELAISDALLDATETVIGRVADASLGEDCSEEEATALEARLRAPFADQVPSGDGDGRIVAGVYVPAELIAVLSGENLALLEQGIAEGLLPYAVLVHLESDPATAESLVGWLTAETRALANRTVVTGSESWFEFLLLSPLSPVELAAALQVVDPERHCVRRVRRLTADPQGEPVADAAQPTSPVPEPEPQAARRATAAANVIRVRSEAIDAFLDEIGEMRAAVGALSHAARGRDSLVTLAHARQLADRLPPRLRDELLALLQNLADREHLLRDAEERIAGIVGRVHQGALEFRVVPIDVVFNRLPRVVRDLAARQAKSVEVVLEGRDVRIDKSMVEALSDPLLHMVRNALDHGIETGEERRAAGKPERARLTLRASQRGSEIVIEIGDDGRGLSAEAIRAKAVDRGLVTAARAAALDDAEVFPFIFEAGLSTATAVTETSGRGVGMDVVLNTVHRLNGDITIRSERGNGTTFTLTLPVSAALQTALIVRVAGQSLAIPERNVATVTEIDRDEIRQIGAGRSMLYRQAVLPLHDLGVLLGLSQTPADDMRPTRPVVVASSGRSLIGLEVTSIEHRQELFLKDLHPLLAQFPGIGGASVLGDGRVVLVLDGDELIQLASRGIERPEAEQRAAS
jgi:chemotaxis protein histidine kinase CheA